MRNLTESAKITLLTVSEFEERANQIFESFVESLYPTFTIPISQIEEGHYEDHWDFIYSERGSLLADRMLSRLYKLGKKLFPNQTFVIQSYLYQEA